MTFEDFGKVGHAFELAARYHLSPVVIAVSGRYNGYAVQNKIELPFVADDLSCVPLANSFYHAFFSGDQIIEITGAVFIDLSIGMAVVIEHLHFRTSIPYIFVLGRVVLHPEDNAAVAIFRDLPIELQVKILILPVGYQVAAGFAMKCSLKKLTNIRELVFYTILHTWHCSASITWVI